MKKIFFIFMTIFVFQTVAGVLSETQLDNAVQNLPNNCDIQQFKLLYNKFCIKTNSGAQGMFECSDGIHRYNIEGCNTIIFDGKELTRNLSGNETIIKKTYFFENLIGISVFDISLITITIVGITITLIKFRKELKKHLVSFKFLLISILKEKGKKPKKRK